MPMEGFNYKEFAQTLANQAAELIPADFQKFQRDYVTNTIKNFATLSGEAIYNDDKSNFTNDQGMFITQIIAEWSFHKSVDVIKAGILPDYWDRVMQKIAFTIFEIAKQTVTQGLPQEEILPLVEHHVKKSYQAALEELKQHQIIDDAVFDRALHQSNIDEMMNQMQQEKEHVAQEAAIEQLGNKANSKILKLVSVALLLKQMPETKVEAILNKFNQDDIQTIIQYMQMPDLEHKVDRNIAMKCLHEIRTSLPEPKNISPEKVLSKMNKIFRAIPKAKIESVVSNERPGVKEFISKAQEGELSQIPPKVANIIAQHLEEAAS